MCFFSKGLLKYLHLKEKANFRFEIMLGEQVTLKQMELIVISRSVNQLSNHHQYVTLLTIIR